MLNAILAWARHTPIHGYGKGGKERWVRA